MANLTQDIIEGLFKKYVLDTLFTAFKVLQLYDKYFFFLFLIGIEILRTLDCQQNNHQIFLKYLGMSYLR